jgi:hypothetical protein
MSVKFVKDNIGKDLYSIIKKEINPSIKELLFAIEYFTNGFNATEAYKKTIARKGAKQSTCEVNACYTLKNTKVQQTVRKMVDAWIGEKKETFEKKIIDQLTKRSFYDPLMFVNIDGTMKFKSEDDIPKEWRCCIDSIERKYYGKDAEKYVIVLKLADRDKARTELAKYIELYKGSDSIQLNLGEETINKLDEIFGGGKG